MHAALSQLGLSVPVIAAPMAGGPSTPELVVAAARAGALGLLAGGYKSGPVLAEQIAAVHAETEVFGVNLFAPNPVPVDPAEFRRYVEAVTPELERYGLEPPDEPTEDDDRWSEKLDVLRADPVPIVSFTFGIPDTATLATLRKAGSVLVQTVTSADEARVAAAAGVDALAVQASLAGGHSGTFTPSRPPDATPVDVLIAQVRAAVDVPVVAAGGMATSADLAAALHAGADAVMVGTVLLRADESGASAPYKAAIADHTRGEPVLTRAFSGRPARGLRNEFLDRYDATAPLGYPAVHYLTSPLRRAASAAGDAERINIWAGSGYREATAEPAAQIIARLARNL